MALPDCRQHLAKGNVAMGALRAEARASGCHGPGRHYQDIDPSECNLANWATRRLDARKVQLLAAVGEQVRAEFDDDASVAPLRCHYP